MSSAVFTQVALGGGPDKAERLFRAAISAFCSLARPSRREVAQLDDLALPLFERVSAEARRHAAAALSECIPAPPALVRRLCEQPVEIAAPLLVRSRQLSDIDLLRIIGHQSLAHARAIAGRADLNPHIARLVEALLAREDGDAETRAPPPAAARGGAEPQLSADEARRRLRAMMRPAGIGDGPPMRDAQGPEETDAYDRLSSAALAGAPAILHRALAGVLQIGLDRARGLTEAAGYADLLCALRALDLSAEKAFLVAAATFPRRFGDVEAIRLFLARFAALHPSAARETVRTWRLNAAGTDRRLRAS